MYSLSDLYADRIGAIQNQHPILLKEWKAKLLLWPVRPSASGNQNHYVWFILGYCVVQDNEMKKLFIDEILNKIRLWHFLRFRKRK